MRRAGLRATAVALAVIAVPAAIGAAGARPGSIPPPTPVPPNGEPSPFVTELSTPAAATAPPQIAMGSAILADLDSGQVLFHQAQDQRRPIASVTKIMTALLVLERAHLDEVTTVRPEATFPADQAGLSTLGLVPGERIAVRDLLYALLLQSANDAAIALAEQVSGSEARFEAAMNARARELGMDDTRFRSSNGLDDEGFSSAGDLVTLTRTAYLTQPEFGRIAATQFRDIPSPAGPPRTVQNRNVLLWLYPGAFGAKTGYTARAGFCVVAAAQRDGRRLVAVILGHAGEPFSDAAALLNYGFAAFTQQRFLDEGEDVGTVSLPGGTVTVRTGGGLEALVPVSSVGKVTRTIAVTAGAAFPPAPGEQVATLEVAIPGLHLGSVPLVAADIPPPPPVSSDGPWWERATGSVVRAVSGTVRAAIG
ncbi:MAG: D-alanyl-D-alanine carboxypeptidase family protein [Actinomycetota bacterium]